MVITNVITVVVTRIVTYVPDPGKEGEGLIRAST